MVNVNKTTTKFPIAATGEPFEGKGDDSKRPPWFWPFIRRLFTEDDVFTLARLTFARGLLLVLFWSIVIVALAIVTAICILIIGLAIQALV